jgi:glycosyltransferase involved in cell wall biosynthesis
MKILILSTSERAGGAAIAANRLMHALRKAGHDAKMLVRDKQTDDRNVVSVNSNWLKQQLNFIRFAYERWVIFVHNRFSRKHLFAVSIANTGVNISRHPLVKAADVIHLHWVNQGFLSLKNIRQLINTGKPIVWTMHDMWAFTGTCHYADTCRQYETQCNDCLLLKNGIIRTFIKKGQTISRIANFVGSSQWIANQAKASALLRNAAITNIPIPVATDIFMPFDKAVARAKFNLPQNKKIVLFAAAKLSDIRKGIAYFVEACCGLTPQACGKQIEVLILGGKLDNEMLHKIPLKTHISGYLHETADIAAAYAASDVFVIPSLEDNLPNTIMEAMACGTPCVGFDTGGIPEMIDHKINGYLAEYKSAKDLAEGILWCLENYDTLTVEALKKVERCYSEEVVAGQYIELYNKLI